MIDIKKLSLTAVVSCLIIGCNPPPPEPQSTKQRLVIPLEGRAETGTGNGGSIVPEPTFSPGEIAKQKSEAVHALDMAHKALKQEGAMIPQQMVSEQILLEFEDQNLERRRDDGEEKDPFLSTIIILAQPLKKQF